MTGALRESGSPPHPLTAGLQAWHYLMCKVGGRATRASRQTTYMISPMRTGTDGIVKLTDNTEWGIKFWQHWSKSHRRQQHNVGKLAKRTLGQLRHP